MLLSEGRTRTRRYLDREGDTTLFADAEVNDELKSAQHVVWRMVGDRTNLWTTETTKDTASTGAADLSAIKPLRIVSVAITAGGISRWRVRAARPVDGLTNLPQIQSLRISYVPRPAFPSADGNAFVWGPGASGAGFDTELLDRLLCLLAAAALKVKEKERNPALEQQIDAAKADVLAMVNVPRFTIIPLDTAVQRWTSPMFYIMTAPDTLQLVA